MGDLSPQETRLPILEVQSSLGSKNIHYPLVYYELPEEFKARAIKDLNETEEKKMRGISELKEFMKEQNLHKFDNNILTAILRNCKYDMKKSKLKLKKLETLRNKLIDELSQIPLGTIEQICDDMGFGALPYRDAEGNAILYTRPYGMDITKYTLDNINTCLATGILLLISLPITTVAGIAYFGECKHRNVYHFLCLLNKYPTWISRVFSFPVRISKIEFLNPNSFCSVTYAALRPILPKKIRDRITFHSSAYANLHKDFSPEILPEEFGGNMGALSNNSYKKELLDFVKKLRLEGEREALCLPEKNVPYSVNE